MNNDEIIKKILAGYGSHERMRTFADTGIYYQENVCLTAMDNARADERKKCTGICPECGTELNFGLSDHIIEIALKSRLFKNKKNQ